MHFSKYISKREAGEIAKSKIKKISLTPTAHKQTPDKTIRFLKEKGIEIEVLQRRGRPKKLGKEEITKIMAARQEGLSFYRISKMFNIPKSTIFDYYKRNKHLKINNEEIEEIKVKEAKKLFEKIITNSSNEKIKQLAIEGIRANSQEDIEFILRGIISYIN